MDLTSYLFSNVAQNNSSGPILLDAQRPTRTITGPDYVDAVKRIATGLRSLGVANQDGVGLLSLNDIYYGVLGDGVVAAGAVFAGIPTFVKQAELAAAIRAAGLRWLFVAPEFLPLALATVHAVGLPSSALLVFDPPGRDDDPYNGPHPSLSSILAAPANHPSCFRNANEGKNLDTHTAFRLFTSGSTGSVKAAVVSHKVCSARLGYYTRRPALPSSLHAIAMHHASGLLTHHQAVLGLSTMCVSRTNDSHSLVDRIASLAISQILMTPKMAEDIVRPAQNARETWTEQLAPLKCVYIVGGPCRQQLVDNLLKILPPTAQLWMTYGSTEAGAITAQLIDDSWVTGQVGYAAPETELRIVDPETSKPVQPGAQGEICIRSEYCFNGYYNADAANRASFLPDEPAWFRTGDKGFLHPDTGMLTFVGRLKQIFIVNDEEVWPGEVESELLSHGDVADAYITSTQARDNQSDLECMAYVVPRSGSNLTAQGLVDFVASKLAIHKAPTGAVVFCDAIPRGGIDKPLVNEVFKLTPLAGSAKFLDVHES